MVALANLHPPIDNNGELDSYMYQTAGHEMIGCVAQALGLPLHRRALQGTSLNIAEGYKGPHAGDEVEDLFELIKGVKEEHKIEAVAVGAVLSDYQRVRVEDVCSRLGLNCLSYLWSRDQAQLLEEILACQIDAVLVKVASIGLDPKLHLNQSLSTMKDHLSKLNKDYGVHVCGEGGEYETLTLDCPLYNSKIVIDECETVIHADSDIAPVGYLKVKKYHLEPKPAEFTSLSWADRVKQLPMATSETFTAEFLSRATHSPPLKYVRPETTNLVSEWPEKYKTFVVETENEVFCSLQAEKTGDLVSDTKGLMDRLQEVLAAHSCGFPNLSYVLLYISDMSQFVNINAVYTTYFGINPPPRICVEAALPSTSLFHAQVLCHKDPTLKKTRHVQSISHWAPSCIGPYSQASHVGSNVFVSGQIPFVPGAMKAVPTGFPGQCQLALEHALTVGEVMGVTSEHITSAHCYVYNEDDVAHALSSSYVRSTIPSKAETLCVVVPRLPRDVSAEWHVNFNLEGVVPHTIATGDDDLKKVCTEVGSKMHQSNLYFVFYSAGSIDVNQLIAGIKEVNSNHLFVPIPVIKVVSEVEHLTKKYQVACVQVPGYGYGL